MTRYTICMGMDEFTIDDTELFNKIFRIGGPLDDNGFVHLRGVDGRLRWVNISQIKMIEEVEE